MFFERVSTTANVLEENGHSGLHVKHLGPTNTWSTIQIRRPDLPNWYASSLIGSKIYDSESILHNLVLIVGSWPTVLIQSDELVSHLLISSLDSRSNDLFDVSTLDTHAQLCVRSATTFVDDQRPGTLAHYTTPFWALCGYEYSESN